MQCPWYHPPVVRNVFFLHRSSLLQLLRIFGVLVFVWILWQIDLTLLLASLKKSDLRLIAIAIVFEFLSYAAKTVRWHILQRGAGLHPHFSDSWRTFMIGIFLSVVTPGKIGDLGRAGYLRHAGLSGKRAFAVAIVDRVWDLGLFLLLALVSIAALWGEFAFLVAAIVISIGFVAVWCLMHFGRRMVALFLPDLLGFRMIASPVSFAIMLIATLAGWVFYFAWAAFLAQSVGIAVPFFILVGAITMSGVVALIPISLSGFGTRDAALVALLGGYGVAPEQAVALGFLMFITILISTIPGLIAWVRGLPKRPSAATMSA